MMVGTKPGCEVSGVSNIAVGLMMELADGVALLISAISIDVGESKSNNYEI